jgi:integrin beta 3
MSEKSMIPIPQYTHNEAIGVSLATSVRALAEVRALSRLSGPQGEPGPEGKRGLTGIGEKGDRGEQGKQGPMGPAGTDGRDGERGAKGADGRNAADLTLLQEYIDQRVERTIEAIAFTTSDGGRTLQLSLGDRKIREIKTALVLYVGGWKDATRYDEGDAISNDGSIWIAKTSTNSKPPSDDWRLAVRAGRDYRPDEKRKPEPVRFK